MRMFSYYVGTLITCTLIGCSSSPSSTTHEKAKRIYSVSWSTLTRDYTTAESYQGQQVMVHLQSQEYSITGSDIVVHAADNGAPPILYFKGISQLPRHPYPHIIITGLCKGPTRDGHWRKRNCDFHIVITGCSISTIP